ncbi:MAG TPA: DEAD/DEAH box helicase [Chthoniobacterales bacterium]
MSGLDIAMAIPDLWQQDAVRLLRDGLDVVVHAPTGAGKTFIFEMLVPSLRGQAVFTVPTRALANDKLAEWRARGWDVGISTGDIAENLNAKVIVATLETQKGAFLRKTGPRLLVIDEYQLLSDERRGVNYELCIALAPPGTQLLLLSGSVENPQVVTDWLKRLGRRAVLIQHAERPVPLEEVLAQDLRAPISPSIAGFWPKLVARALAAGLGPLLIFAPRRKAAEEMAAALASNLPSWDPLTLSPEQMALAGEKLARALSGRVAWHHSGLSYALRAGLIEPLAKRGHLRVVVATMGLAAGINFSMRSVLVAGTSYQSGFRHVELRPDELLQMFGRAGRRGLDEVGYVLTTTDLPRLFDSHPQRLRRAAPLDWPSFIAVMQAAVERDEDPCAAAVEVTGRLFSAQRIAVGYEDALQKKATFPCGLMADTERARLVRRFDVEMFNSRGEWELQPKQAEHATLGDALIFENDRWRPALSLAATLTGIGTGNLCKLPSLRGRKIYGREWIAATVRDGVIRPTQPVRKQLREAGFRETRQFSEEEFFEKVRPILEARIKTGKLVELTIRLQHVVARISYADEPTEAFRDRLGAYLILPPTRRELPEVCRDCPHRPDCEARKPDMTPAMAWRSLGLVEPDGKPTLRGRVFSFFNHGEGLAIAAALERDDYPIEDVVYDLADIRAGHRFAGDDSPYGGRLGFVCQQAYRRMDFPGYLEMGVPVGFGNGAGEIMRELALYGGNRNRFLTEELRPGDIERAQLEWRSLLRQVVAAPPLEWQRWIDLQTAARIVLESAVGKSVRAAFPALSGDQMQRYGKALPQL